MSSDLPPSSESPFASWPSQQEDELRKAPQAKATEFYVTIERAAGKAPVRGEGVGAGKSDKIVGIKFDFQVVSPRDPAGGQAVGKRQYGPVTITKGWGAASPELFEALVTNELLASVLFEFVRTDVRGAEVVFQTVKLTDAYVSRIRRVADAGAQGDGEIEEIAFTFSKIEIADQSSKQQAVDDRSGGSRELETGEASAPPHTNGHFGWPGETAPWQGDAPEALGQVGSETPRLPFLLAGPIVRRVEPTCVWLWFACSNEITACTPKLAVYESSGELVERLNQDHGFYPLAPPRADDLRVVALGEHLWIALVAARPRAGEFPKGWIYGYDLAITCKSGGSTLSQQLTALGLDIAYAPFRLPTFRIDDDERRIVHGSCRRPGADGQDAFVAFDQWLTTQTTDKGITLKPISSWLRPSALFLTGDQIYADDVAPPLFAAVQKLARDVFGYAEKLPRAGASTISVDDYGLPSAYSAGGSRKQLTCPGKGATFSPIGFTTDDGECHLLSFPEWAAMYLLVWNEGLCKQYGVEQTFDGWPDEKGHTERKSTLIGFPAAVARARRVLANMATYMICDDHEITDDWNLDHEWETKTHNPTARRIIANGLAAYWAFQAWGNDPSQFDLNFEAAITRHLSEIRAAKGEPGVKAANFDGVLLARHWSFVAPTHPQALFVDTRTRRETHYPSSDSSVKAAVLSGPLVWPFLKQLIAQNHFVKKEPLLIVLPTPLLPHRAMLWAQQHEYKWPADRYKGDYELYGNNPGQRPDLIKFLHDQLDPPVLTIFSGDVHHGSVVQGLYVGGKSKDAIYQGKGDWGMRVAQVTSSPVKNIKTDAYREGHWWLLGSDEGHAGEYAIPQLENQYKTMPPPDGGVIALRSDVRHLDGDLGRHTYIFENHLCVVRLTSASLINDIEITFVGATDAGKLATATGTLDTHNDPARFQAPVETTNPGY